MTKENYLTILIDEAILDCERSIEAYTANIKRDKDHVLFYTKRLNSLLVGKEKMGIKE